MSFLRILLVAFSVVMLSNVVYAGQNEANSLIENGKLNKDSILVVKLVHTISQDSLKLVQLKGQLEEKIKIKEETAIEAQKLAFENNRAARLLSKDPLEKKLAKRADKLSSQARSSAKKARAAADALKSLNKNITSLERKIEKSQSKLDKIKAKPLQG